MGSPDGVPVVKTPARVAPAGASEVVPLISPVPSGRIEIGCLALAMAAGVVQAAPPTPAEIAALAALGWPTVS